MKFTYPSGSTPLAGYTIKRGIGRGGFGEVYYAVSDGGKDVAMKLIRRHLDIELRGVRQCLNLKHPHLLALHDIRTDEGDDRWVIMEYISGESLDRVIERNPNGMPVEEVLGWIRGIASGVAYLHDHGIVHRDLKPGNIFVDEGIVKIGDYGLSKFVSCSRRSGQTESVGTVHYMAPEIANGRYGKEIDTYALGILLYEMLTGRVPFDGESVGEVLMKHLTAEPDLHLLAEPFRTICSRALAKDPAARFGSVKEFLAMLPDGPTGAAAVSTPIPVAHHAAAADSSAADRNEAAVEAEVVEEAAAAVPTADVDDEPLWRLIKDQSRQLHEKWVNANLHPAIKAATLIGIVIALLSSSSFLFPILFMLVMAYGIYRVIRAVVLAPTTPRPAQPPPVTRPVAAPAPTPQQPHHAARGHRRRQSWHGDRTTVLIQKTAREKLTELSGAMLSASGIAVTLALVMMILRGGASGISEADQLLWLSQFAWLAMVGTVGSWLVMIPSKCWEGRDGEQTLRRFGMLVSGLLLGLAAFGAAEFLQVYLPYTGTTALFPGYRLEGFHGVDGTPRLAAFLALFGFLMPLMRWWRLADPGRGTRLSVWLTACYAFVAFLLSRIWDFPLPWGVMVAVSIAITVQLASGWVPVSKRRR